jgi:hypothetical protein
MPSAHVQSVQHLEDFQAALAAFGQQAREAMCSLALEIRRARDWVDDQYARWQAEVRRCEEDVFKARQELARKRMMRIGDRRPDTTEEEVALAKAVYRLNHAEEKKANCKAWILKLPDAIEEYEGQAKPMDQVLESGLPRMLAYLDRKIDILEAYADLSPTTQAAPEGPPS